MPTALSYVVYSKQALNKGIPKKMFQYRGITQPQATGFMTFQFMMGKEELATPFLEYTIAFFFHYMQTLTCLSLNALPP